MTTGKRIQSARKQAGLSQKQLGERLGVSGSMIGQYETDQRRPKIQTLQKIATALNTTVSFLISDPSEGILDNEDRDFLENLPTLKPLDELPAAVKALNMLIRESGENIYRFEGQYVFSWKNGSAFVSEEDVEDMVTAALSGLSVAKDMLIRRLRREQRKQYGTKAADNGTSKMD